MERKSETTKLGEQVKRRQIVDQLERATTEVETIVDVSITAFSYDIYDKKVEMGRPGLTLEPAS